MPRTGPPSAGLCGLPTDTATTTAATFTMNARVNAWTGVRGGRTALAARLVARLKIGVQQVLPAGQSNGARCSRYRCR